MDYQKFLNKTEEAVLPYLGGDSVDAPDRRLRVSHRVAPGWWRFRIEGRAATAIERAEPGALLAKLPRIVGHLLGTRIVHARATVETVWFLPEDEPARFALCAARRWHSGDVIFEELPFETEAEDSVRRAFEDARPLGETKGVPASLRAAYAFAQAEEAAATAGVALSPLEVAGAIAEIANGGRAAADTVIARLDAERRAAAEEAERRIARAVQMEAEGMDRAARMSRSPAAPGSGGPSPPPEPTTNTRIEAALSSAGAELLALRRLAGGLYEVSYRFMHERFTSVVHAASLQVVDAGVCLDGSDDLVTLESLPGVIREAINEGVLVITRRRHDD